MFERMAMGWQLGRQSWRVLMLDKELLVFPFLSGVSCVLVFASFIAPLWATGVTEEVMAEQRNGEISQYHQILGYVLTFAFYVVNYFVIIFFNSALVACAIIRFKGGNPTLRDGFVAAFSRLPQILGWALVSATVGLILEVIESRSSKAGQIIAALLGMAWSAVTYFVVPVIVIERVGPIEATKRSLAVLKKTWGEALTARFGIGFYVFLVSLLGIVPIGVGVYLLVIGQAAIGGVAIGVGVVMLILSSLISSTLNAIIRAALYLYAAEGQAPEAFDGELLGAAFGRKR